MSKLNKNNRGFGGVELILIIVIVVLIGVVGWLVYKNHNKVAPTKTAAVNKTIAKTTQGTSTNKSVTANPYAGWKTYNSILNSGLSFEYPANWVFTPANKPFTNNNGGVENDSSLTSAVVQTKPGVASNVATNQYMCVSFDEYGGTWSYGGWNLVQNYGPLLSSESFKVGSVNLSLNTYQGSSPMLDTMELVSVPPSNLGSQYINTQNNFSVIVQAQFNCGQGGQSGITNLNADFNSQPETAIAKLIMKSIKF